MGWVGCGRGLSSGTAAAAGAAPRGCGNAWDSPGGSVPVGGQGGEKSISGVPKDLQPLPKSPPIPKYTQSLANIPPYSPPRTPSPTQTHQESPPPNTTPSSSTLRRPKLSPRPPTPHPTALQDTPRTSQPHNAPPSIHTHTSPISPLRPTAPPPHLQHLGGDVRWRCPLRGGSHGDGRRWAGGLGGRRGAGGASPTSFSAFLLLCLCPHQLLSQQHP